MNIHDLALAAKGKDTLTFKFKGVEYRFRIDGAIETVEGNSFTLRLEDYASNDFVIVCDHPFDKWERIKEHEIGFRRCLRCERTIQIKGVDIPTPLPEKIFVQGKSASAEEFSIKSITRHLNPFIEPKAVRT